MFESDRVMGPPAANESQALDIADKSVVVNTITIRQILLYEDAARKSGFEIEIVAEEGDYYLTGKAMNALEAAEKAASVDEFRQALVIRPVVSRLPVSKGSVAISIQKPTSEPDHAIFYQALRSL